MMKRMMPFLFGLVICSSLCLADYIDGFITSGEYEYFVEWNSYNPPLIVESGGADWIEIRDYGRLEVRSTSAPLGLDVGGIWDILLVDDSELLYLDGLTDIITIGANAEAVLKGGSINYIASFQYTNTKHIDLYGQPGWSWETTYDPVEQEDIITGITGLWEDGSGFDITFVNKEYLGYDPVWMNINIVEVPEPATLFLLGFGAVLIRKR